MLNKMYISEFRLDVFGETVGLGGGLVALQFFLTIWLDLIQLLSTIKNGTGRFNLQSNELILKFLRQQRDIWKFLWDAFKEKPRYLRVWKRALELLTTNPMSTLRGLNDHPFYMYLVCPQGMT